MKKKIIWGLIIILVIGVIGWFDLPYIKSTKNLISSQDTDYTYERISIDTWSEEYAPPVEIRDEAQMNNIIDKIDGLKLRKTKKLSFGSDSIRFFGRYTNDKNMTIVDELFTISFSESENGNILTIDKRGTYNVDCFKILDKDFNIEEFIKELMGEDI